MVIGTDSETAHSDVRARLEALDAQLHAGLIERARLLAQVQDADTDVADGCIQMQPGRDADLMRQLVEEHQGPLPLTSIEHIWRILFSAELGRQGSFKVHLDGSAELLETLDLARFHFGFDAQLLPGADAADVVGEVAATDDEFGIVALDDRADLPWWRGLSLKGAEIVARLPFLVLDQRPADMPALVIAPASAIALKAGRDTIVYDARWSGALPGSLMMHGLEVVSFHRSASGVDALVAVSADLSEDQILAACAGAGATPDVLRMVGGYSSPIDVEGDADEDFEAASAEG
ncbi:chorismate mutase [Roseibium sp.]|uniref:chorismate mutase n=1 Tax=Roseibium sp. TaxID=1936156 RepID=UPI003A972271